MPKGYKEYAMRVDNVFLGIVVLRDDIIDRFNITFTADETDIPPELRYRKQHRRNIFTDGATDATAVTVQVSRTAVAYIAKKRNIRSGKKIRVPTGLTSTPASAANTGTTGTAATKSTARTVTLSFPGSASNFEIARWINTKFTANKPDYFITPAGSRFPVKVAQLAGAVAAPDATP